MSSLVDKPIYRAIDPGKSVTYEKVLTFRVKQVAEDCFQEWCLENVPETLYTKIGQHLHEWESSRVAMTYLPHTKLYQVSLTTYKLVYLDE